MDEIEPLKEFIRNKLDAGVTPEQLRRVLEGLEVSPKVLEEVLHERGIMQTGSPQSGVQVQQPLAQAQALQPGQTKAGEQQANKAQAEQPVKRPFAKQPVQQEKKPVPKKKIIALIIVIIALIVAFVFLNFSGFLQFNQVSVLTPVEGPVSSEGAISSATGFSLLEFRGGSFTGFVFDQEMSFFSLFFEYKKSAPAVIPFSSVKISKGGINCSVILIPAPENYVSSIKPELESAITLPSNGIFEMKGIIAGQGCGMAQRQFSYMISFETIDKALKETRDDGEMQGIYEAVTQKNDAYSFYNGYYALEKKDFAGAENNFKDAIAANPKNDAYSFGLIKTYIESEQYGKASYLIDALTISSPGETSSLLLAGVFNFEIKNFEKANRYLESFLEFEPENEYGLNLYFETFLEMQDYEKGAETAEKIAASLESPLTANYYAGLFNYNAENYEKAGEILKQNLESYPTDRKSIALLNKVYADQNKFDEIIELSNSALSFYPSDPEFLYWLGYGQYYTKKYKDSLANLETSVELNPENANAWFILSKIYEKAGDTAKQQEAEQKYTELTSTGTA